VAPSGKIVLTGPKGDEIGGPCHDGPFVMHVSAQSVFPTGTSPRLMTDYALYVGGSVVEGTFYGEDWRSYEPAGAPGRIFPRSNTFHIVTPPGWSPPVSQFEKRFQVDPVLNAARSTLRILLIAITEGGDEFKVASRDLVLTRDCETSSKK